MSQRLQDLLARYVEHHVEHGTRLAPEELCRDCPELIEPLVACIREYDGLQETLAWPPDPTADGAVATDRELPEFAGFRTLERLGGGGGGEVFKLQDLSLGRTVAGKVVRAEGPLRTRLADFLREARSLALFKDPRIVRIHELRADADPPVLLMEYVEGFELGKIGGSLEYAQRARVMAETAEAIHGAHELGIQHRDLKPANIMLDTSLAPRILDFGLSRGEPHRGHGVGTLGYMAPEQLDPKRPIDARTDIYALGVILYELLSGAAPYSAGTTDEMIDRIRTGSPALPMEIEPGVPEPLQAIALKAMEVDPAERYATARELAADLRRYLANRPVLARPTVYQTALERRLRPHLEQIREWSRLQLIHPHEAERLSDAYRGLDVHEDDWILQSRALSFSQIALYLGAFLLVFGSVLYFAAYLLDAVSGFVRPTIVLGLPFVGLSAAASVLYRRRRQAVGVAFHLGAVLVLPLLLLILFQEMNLWPPVAGDENDLLGDGVTSNRQLQVATLLSCLWALRLALGTRTVALSACFTMLLFGFHTAVLADFGLRTWFSDGTWDLLALHLAPLVAACAGLGGVAEWKRRPWLARPLYLAAAGLFVVTIELLALDGRAFDYLGVTMSPLQHADVTDPTLLDTLTAMTVNGLLIYLLAWVLDHRGTSWMRAPAWFLYTLAPFTVLEPIAYLSQTAEYSLRFDWIFLALSLAAVVVSRFRQRKSFYVAGVLNTGVALYLITNHNEWFDRPAWAVALVVVGLVLLVAGFGLDTRERTRATDRQQ